MPFFAVRIIYEHYRESDTLAMFGEQILLLEADDDDDLAQMVDAHWTRTVELNPTFKRIGFLTAFRIGDRPLTSGTEIWSELSESSLTPEDFVRTRYEQFLLKPDDDDKSS
jgi:hypothetical protein